MAIDINYKLMSDAGSRGSYTGNRARDMVFGHTQIEIARRLETPFIQKRYYYVKNQAQIKILKKLLDKLEKIRTKLLCRRNIKHPNFFYKLRIHSKNYEKVKEAIQKYSSPYTHENFGWQDVGMKSERVKI